MVFKRVITCEASLSRLYSNEVNLQDETQRLIWILRRKDLDSVAYGYGRCVLCLRGRLGSAPPDPMLTERLQLPLHPIFRNLGFYRSSAQIPASMHELNLIHIHKNRCQTAYPGPMRYNAQKHSIPSLLSARASQLNPVYFFSWRRAQAAHRCLPYIDSLWLAIMLCYSASLLSQDTAGNNEVVLGSSHACSATFSKPG